MQWKHKCSLEWMKARQQCLTASDVIGLLPVTKTGRKRTINDESYLKVLANKLVTLTKEDCISHGAAARGHILEPYAIDLFNEQYANIPLYHWDDIVVVRSEHEFFDLAFSPDAMSWSMDAYDGLKPGDTLVADPVAIGEVKCYGAEHHMVCGYTNKKDLEERWQVATAMAVCNNIVEASIIFYNPSMRNQMYIAEYERDDLEDEIEMILEVERNWKEWFAGFGTLDRNYLVSGTGLAEQDIIREIMKKEELNPEGERSVIL